MRVGGPLEMTALATSVKHRRRRLGARLFVFTFRTFPLLSSAAVKSTYAFPLFQHFPGSLQVVGCAGPLLVSDADMSRPSSFVFGGLYKNCTCK
ncbi:hypothetical protein EVAR_53811_1 [Eumeta japonica]|uniref:Uncharacterized protein n=1 Tax=Eumeta variegata TaxID=151549 RepID=A0A4C1Y066_EUMVA|nr:hypothetical protein EVAR_53811_1 [Eumeta japonica]